MTKEGTSSGSTGAQLEQPHHPKKEVYEHNPAAALSAMSIQFDKAQLLQQPTYQQPASTLSSSTLRAPQSSIYQQAYSRPYSGSASPEPIDIPAVSLKELRGLQTSENGSFKRPHAHTSDHESVASSSYNSSSRRRSSASARASPRPQTVTGYPSHATTSTRPPQPIYSSQEQQHQSYSQHASPTPLQQHAYTQQYQSLPSHQQEHQRPHASHNVYKMHTRQVSSGSISSESSYAASETSDVLNNSVGGRSSSGGTSATTPGSSSEREKERTFSYKKSISSPVKRTSPPVVRVPVPVVSVSSPSQEQEQVGKRPQMTRPASDLSMTSSDHAKFESPALSQTSSMIRKTSSRYTLSDFNFIKTLGTGSFGRVHLVRSCHNTRFYAIKVLNKDRVVRMKQVEHTNSEREMLERVRHPFLVNLWGTFKDSKNLYMVMDFISGGELFSLLRKSQRFPDPVAKFFAAEVALALDYLHSLDIIYRDLKPENILLAADGHVKITDFGFAKYVPDITWTLCGTPDYLAPEVVQSKGYNKSVDWYALGVLIFEMLAGYPPFFTEDSNPMRLYEKIIAGKIRYPSYFTQEAKDLLKNLLTADLTKRFGNLANGSRDVFGHAYFAEVDWNRLYRKEIPAPYVPRIEGDGDSSNFDSYAEIDLSEYGQVGADPHGHLFASF